MFLKPPCANVAVKCVGNAPRIPNPGIASGRKNSVISRGDRLEIAPRGEDPYAESNPVTSLTKLNWDIVTSSARVGNARTYRRRNADIP